MDRAITPPEIVEVDKPEVSCDGGGPLGHPKVYLSLAAGGRVECPYCDRMFVFKLGGAAGPSALAK